MSIFEPPSLVKTSLLDGFRNARIFKGLMRVGLDGSSTVDGNPPEIVIKRLEDLHQQNPNDWLVLYNLGSWYLRDKQYCNSVHALEKAYALRPNDPRSTFSLATSYRTLSRAKDLNIDIDSILPSGLSPQLIEEYKSNYDPIRSNAELEKLGMTLDESALNAMKLFLRTIRLGVKKDEEPVVRQSLQKMYLDFPHLEIKAKNDPSLHRVEFIDRKKEDNHSAEQVNKLDNQNVQSNLFSDSVQGSDGIFNDAMGHYTRLRFVINNEPQFRYELSELIRLCLWAIATDNKQGDAYVLLANAYSLLDSHVQTQERMLYIKWASAILQHWKETPLRNYPFTKNREIGETLLNNMIESDMRFNHCSHTDAINHLLECKTKYLQDALNPASFTQIKEQLKNN